jgi:thiamine biosynthesis lipoprotein
MRSLSLTFVIALLAAADQIPAAEPARFEFEEPHMGTRFRIVVHATDKDTAITAATAAFKRVRELEAVLSDYKSSSETMKLGAANDREPGKTFSIGDDLAAVLGYALDVSKQSDGAFDVTIGPLSKLWREARKANQLPAEADRTAALAKVGWKNVELDRERKAVRLKLAGMRLDFGGIGKGYAADAALAVLKSHGCSRALVAAAGDITVGDPPPDRDAWLVDVEPLGAGKPKIHVKLTNASVSTSGDLYQFVEIGGERYSHLLNPKTGLGLMGFVRATVVAKHGWQADALTKAACLMPAEQATKLIDSLEGTAMHLATKANANAKEVVVQSKRFDGFVGK